MQAASRIDRVGCSGWNYQRWRHGVFYPPRCPARRWLEFCARSFDTVEVNATFYRPPTARAVQGWIDQTPGDFVLTIEMSRYVTHVTHDLTTDWAFVRFHWGSRGRRGNYWEGFAPRNALRLKQLLDRA
ncbi:MAG: DUF72 domain-containing protein [Gaiellaceae bacterium]